MSKVKSLSAKASLLSAALNLVTLVIFCIYGAVYDYFDAVVFQPVLLLAPEPLPVQDREITR